MPLTEWVAPTARGINIGKSGEAWHLIQRATELGNCLTIEATWRVALRGVGLAWRNSSGGLVNMKWCLTEISDFGRQGTCHIYKSATSDAKAHCTRSQGDSSRRCGAVVRPRPFSDLQVQWGLESKRASHVLKQWSWMPSMLALLRYRLKLS